MAITQRNRVLRLGTPLGDEFLLIQSFRAKEGLSQLFQLEMDVVHEETESGDVTTSVDPNNILGKNVTLAIRTRGENTERFFNGICIRFAQGKRDDRFSHYKMLVVPEVWLLTQNVQSRVFQNITVPDLLRKVLDGISTSFEIQGKFEPRNYIVQYRESDFDFASRLMEEEGIYYYFEHKDGSHKMVIANTPQSHQNCPSKSDIPYFLDVTRKDDFLSSIDLWRVEHLLKTGKYTLWDHHFEIPNNHLEGTRNSNFSAGGSHELEFYDFPGGYAKRYDGVDKMGGERPGDLAHVFEDKQKAANLLQQESDAKYKVISAVSDCCSLTAGHRFKLFNHPNGDQNGQYVITQITHEGHQSPAYATGGDLARAYGNSFTCIPFSIPYRPPLRTPKPLVQGSQTATVVGPPGEEIFTDKYGRIKVQFHWDRITTPSPDSSCWIRVGRDIAGKKWGTMYIPRVGQEVIVDFIDGDPDKPIATGAVYNAEQMPHYELPKFKTLSYIKTRTSPDDGKGFNELRFEDKAGKEQVFVRSQKRMDVRARGSYYKTVGGNRHEIIGVRHDNQPGGNLTVTVGGNHDFHIKDSQYIGVDGKLNEYVKGDVVQDYQSNLQTVVKAKTELNAREITLEAFSKITLKVGSSFVVLDLSGVTIQGPMVKINSGGAASPTGPAIIDEPVDADPADTGEPGYLDRPRRGGGGGRRRRTLNGQHAPAITEQAFRLTQAKGTADDMDRALVAAELSKLPPHVLQRMEDNGTKVVVVRNSVTEERTDLKGVQPRGWGPGQTWDSVPGLYDPNTKQVIIATRGHGTPEGAHVPRTGDGHGSSNLVIHEAMHGVDHTGGAGGDLSTSPNFTNARNADSGTLSNYENQPGSAGPEETFAESAARYYGDDPNDAASHPNLHNYWETDPLNPTNYRP
jgi:type VI secretion system secreted protein VgrG